MKKNTSEISINQGKSQLFNNTGFVFFSETPPAPAIKKKKRTFTREEQYEHGPERKKSFNRRWKSSKKEREELGAIYTDRHLFTFDPSWYRYSSNEMPANKNYIIYISENLEYGRRNAQAFEAIPQGELASLRYSPFKPSSPTSFFKKQSPVTVTVSVNCTERKKESVMNENPIRESIRNCTVLNLTKWGQLKLMAYPDEAIQYAYKALASANPRDPFKWFVSVCLTYCKDNKIAPDWNTMLYLCRHHSMPDNAPMTLGPLLREQQTPQKRESTRQSTITSSFTNFAQKKEEERLAKQAQRAEQLAWNAAHPYEAAKKIEVAMHEETHYKGAISFFEPKKYNPYFYTLPAEQQLELFTEVHNDCACDKNFLSQPQRTSVPDVF